MPDTINIDGETEGGFTKRLAWIELTCHDRCVNAGEGDEDAIALNYNENYIEIDVTQLPKELKIIRITVL